MSVDFLVLVLFRIVIVWFGEVFSEIFLSMFVFGLFLKWKLIFLNLMWFWSDGVGFLVWMGILVLVVIMFWILNEEVIKCWMLLIS